MAPDGGRPARVATFALMAVAYATCEVAAYPDGRPRPFGVTFGIAVFVAAVGLSRLVPSPVAGRRLPRWLTLALGSVLVLPLAAEPLLRGWFGEGFPLELQLVNGLRTLGLLLAGLSAWPRCRRLAGVVALFLALFASAMGDQVAIPYLLGAFAVAGGLWLVLDHRAGQAAATAGASGEEVERVALRMPYREAVVFGMLAALAAGVAFAGPKRVMLTLGEWVPTSGGTGGTDPFARYGVGDGPEETAGENAKAAGMVETDRMIEDTKDALIDAVNDLYGPPHKPPKDRERMVAAGLMEVIQNHGKLPDNRRPSRDFDTDRKGPKTDRKPESQKARGLFEVEGRTPLHVRLVAYDHYDASADRWVEARKPASRLFEPDGGDWMRVGHLRTSADWYAADDRHRLKAAALTDNLVPTPAMLTRFRINKVDRPDYYEWDYDGVLALAGRRRTPPGVVVSTDCRTLDPDGLPGSAFGTCPALCEVPGELKPAMEQLAAEWAGDRPRGWPQIAAVLAKLRMDYTHDRDAAGRVLSFLTETRRGPDYLFATSAALLLRSLGYPTRVCLGYYAAPDAYDPETGHTPVKRTDLHVWPEVQLADGHWLVVEPTPGYEVLPPLRPWRERLADAVAVVAAWGGRNAVALAAGATTLVVLVWRWRRVIDLVQTAAWRLAPGRSWRVVVLRAVRVIERRGRLAGRPRAADQTLAAWAAELGSDRLGELVRLAEWAAYAPGLSPPDADVRAVCRLALDGWTLRDFMTNRGSRRDRRG